MPPSSLLHQRVCLIGFPCVYSILNTAQRSSSPSFTSVWSPGWLLSWACTSKMWLFSSKLNSFTWLSFHYHIFLLELSDCFWLSNTYSYDWCKLLFLPIIYVLMYFYVCNNNKWFNQIVWSWNKFSAFNVEKPDQINYGHWLFTKKKYLLLS